MVRRRVAGAVSRAVTAALFFAAALCALGGCSLFTDSLFPWYLPGVESTLDLRPWIDANLVPAELSSEDWWLDLAVVRDSLGADYVLIVVGRPSANRLIALNGDLSLIGTADNLPLGRRAMVDAAGALVIGNSRFDTVTLAFLGNIPWGGDEPGFARPGIDNVLAYVNNGVSPAELTYWRANPLWGGTVEDEVPVSSDPESRWELMGLSYDDRRAAGQQVVALLRRWGTAGEESDAQVLYLPEIAMTSGSLTGPLVDGHPGFAVSNLDVRRMHYTRKGIVIREYDRRGWLYRFDEENRQRLSFGGRNETLDAYDLDGERFYCIDKDQRMLYRGRTGW